MRFGEPNLIPLRDADFLVWHDQLRAAATTLGATLGITAADLSGLADDNELLHGTHSASAELTGRAQQATQQKNTAKRTAEQKARTLAMRQMDAASGIPQAAHSVLILVTAAVGRGRLARGIVTTQKRDGKSFSMAFSSALLSNSLCFPA